MAGKETAAASILDQPTQPNIRVSLRLLGDGPYPPGALRGMTFWQSGCIGSAAPEDYRLTLPGMPDCLLKVEMECSTATVNHSHADQHIDVVTSRGEIRLEPGVTHALVDGDFIHFKNFGLLYEVGIESRFRRAGPGEIWYPGPSGK